jgi:hypothetical protein
VRRIILKPSTIWAFLALAIGVDWSGSASCFGQNEALRLGSPIGTDPRADAPGSSHDFAAIGRLQQVRRKGLGTMRYALLDASGQIVAFVAPTARFNLKGHLGREVSVTARTINRDDEVAPYVMLESLVPLGVAEPDVSSPQERVATQSNARQGQIQRASHEVIVPPVVAPQDSWQVDLEGSGFPVASQFGGAFLQEGCATCGGYPEPCETCGMVVPCHCRPCLCGPPGWLWLRGEYILWATNGMDLPPLVTTSPEGTPIDEAGVLGVEGTEVLFGGNNINDDAASGYRIRFGGFVGLRRKWGWEADVLDTGDITEVFVAESEGDGSPIIARPFFNINPRVGGIGALDSPPREDSELVSYPDVLAGAISVGTSTQFWTAGGRLVYNICCKQLPGGCGVIGPCGQYYPCGYPPWCKVSFLGGYRHANLSDSVLITEDLTSLTAEAPGDTTRFQIFDLFDTENDFDGGELGWIWEVGWNRWTLNLLLKMALGNVRQRVVINGETTEFRLGEPGETFVGGLLALPSNIGEYERDVFGVIPEVATNLGFYLTPRLQATVGYTFVYWSRVTRPGNAIDLFVNPDQLPPPIDPIEGPLFPRFVFSDTDFWAQGLNVGLDYRW